MSIPLARELENSLKELAIPGVHTWLGTEIYRCQGCAARRQELLESEENPSQITDQTFWLVSLKYRFDILAQDIPYVADHLSLSIAFAQTYFPYLADYESPPYQPTVADIIFWYAIEHGFRLASSGWDRIALLLDLVLKLNVGQYCNFRKVFTKLDKQEIKHIAAYQRLKLFFDGPFLELEQSQGVGLRHEATHLISIRTRFLMEVLEQYGPRKLDKHRNPATMQKLLIAHYEHYIAGVEAALELIDSCWTAG